MGKGKGKKSRKDDMKKKKESKIKGAPSTRPPNPTKIANKLAARKKKAARIEELKAAIAADPSLLKPYDTPVQRDTPMVDPNAAKWPAMFKRSLGLIEMHIDRLTRIMGHLESQGKFLEGQEKLDWELGERGNWRAICVLMDGARLVWSQTIEAAQGVLDPKLLPTKRKLGVNGTIFELMVPKLDAKAKELGYNPKGRGSLGRSMDFLDTEADRLDKDGDSEMSDAPGVADSSTDSDSSDSDSDDVKAKGSEEIQNNVGKDIPRLGADSTFLNKDKSSEKTTNGVESNPYFVIDTEPTPVNLNATNSNKPSDGLSNRKRKMLERDTKAAERLANRQAKKAAYEAKKAAEAAQAAEKPEEESKSEEVTPTSPVVDFRALEAKLRAELEEGSKAQQDAEAQEAEAAEKRAKKKRRRSSEGGTEVVKKVRKDKKSKKGEVDAEDESSVKKKSKRKLDDAEDADNGKKKKKKLKEASE